LEVAKELELCRKLCANILQCRKTLVGSLDQNDINGDQVMNVKQNSDASKSKRNAGKYKLFMPDKFNSF
jgi:hypothetical protein